MSPTSDFLVSRFEMRVSSLDGSELGILVDQGTQGGSMGFRVVARPVLDWMDAVQGGVTGTLAAARDSRSTGDAMRARVLKEFRGEESWGAMRDQHRSLMMSRLSLPQPQGANATAGPGSSL